MQWGGGFFYRVNVANLTPPATSTGQLIEFESPIITATPWTEWREAFCYSENKEQLRELGLAAIGEAEQLERTIRHRLLSDILKGCAKHGAERVCMFSGLPQDDAGKLLQSRWVVSNRLSMSRGSIDPQRYQDLYVDTGYMETMAGVLNDGEQRVTPYHNPSPMLAGFYAAENVCDSVIHHIGGDGRAVMYFSAARYTSPFTPQQLEGVRWRAELLRAALRSF